MKKSYSPATILLPDFNKIDAKKWAVIACDQFTSEPEYWEDVSRIIDGAPSTLDLFLPEVYLSQTAECLPKIHKQMKNYLENILIPYENSMMSIERTLSDGSVRNGLILALDLECYDDTKGSTALTRASEKTVLERLPPRVAIRRQADIELPHTMIFIDDPDKKVIEPLENAKTEYLYDTDLMKGGGHIRGRFLNEEEKAQVSKALDELVTPKAMLARYGDASLAPMLFAVGDGNHSLASAKAFYEELKMNIGDEAKDHPARYALCEIVNIHDEAIKFEPIYRVMFGVDPYDVLNSLKEYANTLDGTEEAQGTLVISKDFEEIVGFAKPRHQLTVGTLESFIKDYLKTHADASCDYIHGENSVRTLSAKENTIGFLFEGIHKEQFFPTVIREGSLPKKTFSMGHAEDKRYYLEARKIKI